MSTPYKKNDIRQRIIETLIELNGESCVTDLGILCEQVRLEEHEWKELEDEFDILFTAMGIQLMIKVYPDSYKNL